MPYVNFNSIENRRNMNVVKTLILLVINFSILLSEETIAQDNPLTIKVLSYNIHYGVGMDSKKDLSRIADVIKQVKPDLVGLQEISDSTMAAEIGELTNMKAVFGPSKETISGYGDAILSRHSFRFVGNQSIPSASSSRYEAMCVDVDLSQVYGEGSIVRFVNTHFDWLETIGSKVARKGAVEVIEIAFFKDNHNLPSLLTGDLNATPNSEPLKLMQRKGWVYENFNKDLFTIPGINPKRQIDYVLTRPAKRWRIVSIEVINEPVASDHLPILMTLELLPEK